MKLMFSHRKVFLILFFFGKNFLNIFYFGEISEKGGIKSDWILEKKYHELENNEFLNSGNKSVLFLFFRQFFELLHFLLIFPHFKHDFSWCKRENSLEILHFIFFLFIQLKKKNPFLFFLTSLNLFFKVSSEG